MDIIALSISDIDAMWAINEQGLPGTGKVSKKEIVQLLEFSSLSVGAYDQGELVGFVVCLPPKTAYGSLNYAWFNEHYESFVYVDRIAVSEENRNKGVGSVLYDHVVSYSKLHGVPVAAEVNRKPPNPGSMRFHHRFGFEEVGVLHHAEKSVTMFLKQA
ncbi:MAG: GNAT family N-acetyltransferase [Candidatus Thermoplasmatota archaeon]|nr:GNAT family N-acetyltransferase [Candidatus Thermoplasmatota archaeon]